MTQYMENSMQEIKFDQNNIIINNNKISFLKKQTLNKINWKKFDVDYIFECTGKFNSKINYYLI